MTHIVSEEFICGSLYYWRNNMGKTIEELRELAKNGVLTHSGTFHADDVLFAALLIAADIISGKTIIRREHSVPKDFKGLVFDVGLGEYDHHQHAGFKVRTTGKKIKYAAFGLLWEDIGAEVLMNYGCNAQAAELGKEYFERKFVELMDATDNFGPNEYPNTMSFFISLMNAPSGQTAKESNDAFRFASIMISKMMRPVLKSASAYGENIFIAQKLGVKPVVTIPEGDPKIPVACFTGTDAQFVIAKSSRAEQWDVHAIHPFKFTCHQDKMEGCVFQHPAMFIAGFDTYEHALNAANKNVRIRPMEYIAD